MSNYVELTDKLHARQSTNQTIYVIWCPGCQQRHGFPVRNDPNIHPQWKFNGDVNSPTFTPSLLHPNPPRCHLNLIDGKIHYDKDCDHALAGETVLMESLKDK